MVTMPPSPLLFLPRQTTTTPSPLLLLPRQTTTTPSPLLLLPRQTTTTSSVRLRKRRDDLAAPGRRKQERHSGDFSCYQSKREAVQVQEQSDAEDWHYVTFLQGLGGDRSGCAMARDNPAIARDNPAIARLQSRQAKTCDRGREREREAQPRRQSEGGDVTRLGGQEVDAGSCTRYLSEVRLRPKPSDHYQPPRARHSGLPASKPGRLERETSTKRCSAEFHYKKVTPVSQDLSQEQSFLQLLGRGQLGKDSDSEESGVFSTGGQEHGRRRQEQEGRRQEQEGRRQVQEGRRQDQEVRRPGLGRRALTQVEVSSFTWALARSDQHLDKVSRCLAGLAAKFQPG